MLDHFRRFCASLRMTSENSSGCGHGGLSIVSFLMIGAALVFIGGCDSSEASLGAPTPLTTAVHASTPNIQTQITLPGSNELVSIMIRDTWYGLANIEDWEANYDLRHDTEGYKGTADFIAKTASSQVIAEKTIQDIIVPDTAIQTFMSIISATPSKEGQYDCSRIAVATDDSPYVATDDSPYIEIVLGFDTGNIKIFSCSQDAHGQGASIFLGGDRVPWAIIESGKTFVADNSHPAQAYDELNPFLKKDEFEKFYESTSISR